MYLTSEKKAELFAKYGNDAKNTGSAESQIALFTFRINHLTEHLKENRKDFGTSSYVGLPEGERYRALPRDHQRAGYQKVTLGLLLV